MVYFFESQDFFNITNDLFVRNDLAETILNRENIENKTEEQVDTMETLSRVEGKKLM
jgi:hypothetical protein